MAARTKPKRADAPRAGGRQPSPNASRPQAKPLPTLGSKVRYTIPEARHLLGMSVSLIYQRLNAGELQAANDGRRRYITDQEIRRYGNLSH
jgi:hypothetical protein